MNSVTEDTYANGHICLIGKVKGQPVVITEQIVRECLHFGDKESDPVEFDHELGQSTLLRMGYRDSILRLRRSCCTHTGDIWHMWLLSARLDERAAIMCSTRLSIPALWLLPWELTSTFLAWYSGTCMTTSREN
ncbi:hypothetical protein R6Q57_010113 [Mikania cordata]